MPHPLVGRLVLILLLAIGAAARAEDASDYERETRSARLATFDLPTAEDVAKSGGEAVRVYIDTAFGGLMPGFVLFKPRTGPARLEVISGRLEGARWRRAVLSAPVPPYEWAQLSAQARRAVDDWLALEARRAHGEQTVGANGLTEIVVCADGQDNIVEVVDGVGVSRGAEHDCEFTQLGDFTRALAAAAMKALPDCGAFTVEDVYGDLTALRMCAMARGDRRSALEAESVALGPDRGDLTKQVAKNVVARWRGRPTAQGSKAFAALWSSLGDLHGLGFRAHEAIGAGSRRAVLRGAMIYLANPDDARYQRADCVETWTKSRGEWRLTRLEVGAFSRFVMAHDPRLPT